MLRRRHDAVAKAPNPQLTRLVLVRVSSCPNGYFALQHAGCYGNGRPRNPPLWCSPDVLSIERAWIVPPPNHPFGRCLPDIAPTIAMLRSQSELTS